MTGINSAISYGGNQQGTVYGAEVNRAGSFVASQRDAYDNICKAGDLMMLDIGFWLAAVTNTNQQGTFTTSLFYTIFSV